MSFEGQARSWLSWARTPDHDAYWQYRDAFFDKLLPAPGRLTLEVGCGEGRGGRELARTAPPPAAATGPSPSPPRRPWPPAPPPPTRPAATWSPTPPPCPSGTGAST